MSRVAEDLLVDSIVPETAGAEPIRAENLLAFAEKFARVGFSEKAFVGCYGMAESTLAISFSKLGAGVVVDRVDGDAL